jgi:O-antigen ligase
MQKIIVNFFNKTLFVTCLFSLLPISFILGNLAINLNILLIICSALYISIKNNFNFDIVFFDKLILIFFFYILLISILKYAMSFQSEQSDEIIIKSISYLRYLLFYFAIRFFVSNNLINLKIFFYISSLSVLFVSLDIIYQFIFGKDIFGFAGTTRRQGGPFGDELIAGGYLQRFSFFLFFALLTFNFFEKTPKKIKFFLFCLLSAIISFALVLAGNRIPFFLFLFIVFLILFFDKNKRIYFFSLAFITIMTLIIVCISNLEIRKHYGIFQTQIVNLLIPFSEDKIFKYKDANNPTLDEKNYSIPYKGKKYKFASNHVKEFYSGYVTWKSNKFFGGGAKTFRYNCPKVYYSCNSHPHNYYLEILTDLGIIGFFLVILFLILIIYKSFFLLQNPILSPFLFIFIGEFFPFKSTGSFFTTSNATFIFLLISVIISILVKKDLN